METSEYGVLLLAGYLLGGVAAALIVLAPLERLGGARVFEIVLVFKVRQGHTAGGIARAHPRDHGEVARCNMTRRVARLFHTDAHFHRGAANIVDARP